MVHSSLIILFSIISIAGAVIYFRKNSPVSSTARSSLIFFIGCHMLFFTVGVAQIFTYVPLVLFIASILLMLVSRVCNGLVLYGKSNWTHYLVTGSIMTVIFVLYLHNI